MTLDVFDAGGRFVARPVEGEVLPAGTTWRAWSTSGEASGVYFLRAVIGSRTATRRVVLLPGP